MEKLKSFVKSYFCTVKVPLLFYYTIMTIPSIVLGLWVLLALAYNGNLLRAVPIIIYLILGNYTFAWFADYKLADPSTSKFLRYIVMRSLVFRRDFSTVVKSHYKGASTIKTYHVDFDKGKIEEDYLEYAKTTVLAIVFQVIARFFIGWWLASVSIVFMILHKKTIRDYQALLDAQRNN